MPLIFAGWTDVLISQVYTLCWEQHILLLSIDFSVVCSPFETIYNSVMMGLGSLASLLDRSTAAIHFQIQGL